MIVTVLLSFITQAPRMGPGFKFRLCYYCYFFPRSDAKRSLATKAHACREKGACVERYILHDFPI